MDYCLTEREAKAIIVKLDKINLNIDKTTKKKNIIFSIKVLCHYELLRSTINYLSEHKQFQTILIASMTMFEK